MITLRFLSFIAKETGEEEIVLDGEKSVNEILSILSERYPSIRDLVDPASPGVTVIYNNRSLVLPKDGEIVPEGEIVISPIIAGGSL